MWGKFAVGAFVDTYAFFVLIWGEKVIPLRHERQDPRDMLTCAFFVRR